MARTFLDVGCGDGVHACLPAIQQNNAPAYGVEIDDKRICASITRGVNVIQYNLEKGLALFSR